MKKIFLLFLLFLLSCTQNECLEGAFGGSCVTDTTQITEDTLSGDTAQYDGYISGDQEQNYDSTETKQGTFPDSASVRQEQALEYANFYREKVGLEPIDELEVINKAAQAHAFCYVAHFSDYQSQGISPHEELSGWEGTCYGENMLDRMKHFGFTGNGASEVIAFYNDPKKAIVAWMETLYHRIPFVSPATESMGYGSAGEVVNAIDVIDFGMGKVKNKNIVVVYPYDGQTNVPPSWDGAETPQPPVPQSNYPSGPIITVTWGKAIPTIKAHKLIDSLGNEVKHMYLTPGTDSHLQSTNTIALYADSPLKPNTTYTVKITLESNNALTWSFKTGQ